uniref:Uncharacterized protein n=1 Tax=Ditylenchus dipsaci TaxID=166011 RepID=A0A915EH94_9BILA
MFKIACSRNHQLSFCDGIVVSTTPFETTTENSETTEALLLEAVAHTVSPTTEDVDTSPPSEEVSTTTSEPKPYGSLLRLPSKPEPTFFTPPPMPSSTTQLEVQQEDEEPVKGDPTIPVYITKFCVTGRNKFVKECGGQVDQKNVGLLLVHLSYDKPASSKIISRWPEIF